MHSLLCRGSSHLALKTKEDTSQQGCSCGRMSGNYRQTASSATQVTVLTKRICRSLCRKVPPSLEKTLPCGNLYRNQECLGQGPDQSCHHKSQASFTMPQGAKCTSVPRDGEQDRMEIGERQLFLSQVPSTVWGAGSCRRQKGEWQVYLMPFIRPPAAETVNHGSSQPRWSHHPKELHLRAEGRRLARREVGLCMKGMQSGKPSFTEFGPPILVALHPSVLPGQDSMTHLGMAGTSLLSWWRKQARFKLLYSCFQLLSSSQPSSRLMPITCLCNVQ